MPCFNGSSPRVRGTATGHYAPDNRHRFIPACAGNRYNRGQRDEARPVHPRVCGEQHKNPLPTNADAGSSPRVRGTVLGMTEIILALRFIPACAGNSPRDVPGIRPTIRPVHPRVCGEQYSRWVTDKALAGSSPRVRGTALFAAVLAARSRFIPACAGNSAFGGTIAVLRPVHPRVCGEQLTDAFWTDSNGGSSPRVRGTVTRGS